MKVKVCGMRDAENIREVVGASPDILGFIFYPASKRYVGAISHPGIFSLIPESIKKAGIFVDEPTQAILPVAERFGLEYVQLHGSETPAVCREIKSKGYKVIKAFGIDGSYDFSPTELYGGSCDYFLFDAKTPLHGGSGVKYNWSVFGSYSGTTPFFLSGGIGPADAADILRINHPCLYAVDINSRFEKEAGIKDVNQVKDFITTIKASCK